MDKHSLDNLVGGVFAIIMTILVLDFKIPEVGIMTDGKLFSSILHLWPLFISYGLSFGVLTNFWVSHHYLINQFSKNVNRYVVYLDVLFLMFLSLIPFSSNLIGKYNYLPTAVFFYGVNLLCISFALLALHNYIFSSRAIHNTPGSKHNARYGKIRIWMIIFFTVAGIMVSFVSTTISGLLYLLPVVVAMIPGSISRLDSFISHYKYLLYGKQPVALQRRKPNRRVSSS